MSRSHAPHPPPYSHAPHPTRSAARKIEGSRPQLEGGQEPAAVELAEALLGAAHMFKQRGNLCFSQAESGLRELSVPRARLLAAVVEATEAGQERVRMGDLAAALRVTARNITTIVDGLESEGLLARKRDSTDRRAILLELTEKGRAHIARIHALQCDLAERMFAPLDAEDRCVLLALLTRLAQHISQVAAPATNGHEEAPA